MFSARSASMNVARPFKAGKSQQPGSRRVATAELEIPSIVATRRKHGSNLDPGVETPG
jgi:hypothetical protein